MVDYREIMEGYDCNLIAVVLQRSDQEYNPGFFTKILAGRIYIKREYIPAAADGAQDLRFFRI